MYSPWLTWSHKSQGAFGVYCVIFSGSRCTDKGRHVPAGILVKKVCANTKILRKCAQTTTLQIAINTQ